MTHAHTNESCERPWTCHRADVESGICSCYCLGGVMDWKFHPKLSRSAHLDQQEISFFGGVGEMWNEAKRICNFVYCRAALGSPQAAYFGLLKASLCLFEPVSSFHSALLLTRVRYRASSPHCVTSKIRRLFVLLFTGKLQISDLCVCVRVCAYGWKMAFMLYYVKQ